MKKIAPLLAVILCPVVVLLLYVYGTKTVQLSTQQLYTVQYDLIAQAVMSILIAIYLIYICHNAYQKKNKREVRLEYLIGIAIPAALFGCTFIPWFDIKILNYFLYDCMSQFAIIAVVHIYLFFYALRER